MRPYPDEKGAAASWKSRRRFTFVVSIPCRWAGILTRSSATCVPGVTRAAYTVLGWRVADIAATIQELTSQGVVFIRYDGIEQDEIGVGATPDGDKVAWFSDPDANVLSPTQFL